METRTDSFSNRAPVSGSSLVKTRLLILSDTHGAGFHPHERADVAIHCGDLSNESKLAEFRTAIESLKAVDAPLKLVIAGNHDFTLDIPVFEKKVAELERYSVLEDDLLHKEYGRFGEVRQLFEAAKQEGVLLLDEGTHHFDLENGAALTIYASPFTPSEGDWGFQYSPQSGHEYSIEAGTDVVITHGPPKGIMDMTRSRQRAGCPSLFAAVARNRPKMHCFGHIHEGWGGKLVTWRKTISESPSHFTDIDHGDSVIIGDLPSLKTLTSNSNEVVAAETAVPERTTSQGSYYTSHCNGDKYQLSKGQQTLFVNAAIASDDSLSHPPWLVDIELSAARPSV